MDNMTALLIVTVLFSITEMIQLRWLTLLNREVKELHIRVRSTLNLSEEKR